ncbi:MAG: hypothetical protein IH588_01085 [Anaerolineales bacterium]|nr:hypothetical protein [Anaerolineales bacterium]
MKILISLCHVALQDLQVKLDHQFLEGKDFDTFYGMMETAALPDKIT